MLSMLSESHRATREHELLRVVLTTLARRASKSSIDPSQLPALPAHLTMVAMLFDGLMRGSKPLIYSTC